MRDTLFVFLGSLMAIMSCRPMSDFKVDSFFQLDSMLVAQSELLSEKGVTVIKSVKMGDQYEEISFRPDTSRWSAEFQIIKDFSLNKPTYVGAFEETKKDQSVLYIKKKDQPIPIKRFEVIFNDHLKKVSGQYFEDKDIFQHERNFELQFDTKGILSTYKIWGFQKMILQDTIQYSIVGQVKQETAQ